ncbi:MAG: hypothetical protein NVS1B9_12190 [Solirubrobacteraceae bacterium]
MHVSGRTAARPRVSVVIPTLNEERNIAPVIECLPDDVFELIFVDGHSADRTRAEIRRLRPDARVLTQNGRGKGDALGTGFAAASGEIIVMLDADGSTDPGEIPAFVEALLAGADVAKGSRFLQGGGSTDITAVRKLGNWLLSGLVNRLYRTRYTDLCYGYNAFWADCLPLIDIACEGFEVEALLNVQIAKAHLRVTEVPSHESPRLHGASNLRPVRDGLRILRIILSQRFTARSASCKDAARLRTPQRREAQRRLAGSRP